MFEYKKNRKLSRRKTVGIYGGQRKAVQAFNSGLAPIIHLFKSVKSDDVFPQINEANLDRRYQIFVSSTYIDLKIERQNVARAILNLGHFPAGMEFFPATDDDQMKYISSIIDDSDYYIIILGGRYGSTGLDGLSYTEKEYDYAVEQGVPICAFIHENIEKLKYEKIEKDPNKLEKLNAFKANISKNKIIRFWKDSEDLESSVVISLSRAFNDKPRTGWSRADQKDSRETLEKINKLNSDLDFWRTLANKRGKEIKSYEEISSAEINIQLRSDGTAHSHRVSAQEIIRHFASLLYEGLIADDIEGHLRLMLEQRLNDENFDIEEISIRDIKLFLEVFNIADFGPQSDFAVINEDKKFLLKSAFLPKKKSDIDDEIPF